MREGVEGREGGGERGWRGERVEGREGGGRGKNTYKYQDDTKEKRTPCFISCVAQQTTNGISQLIETIVRTCQTQMAV